jgi:hypothetical protein
VKEILESCRDEAPHTLQAVDITEARHRDWWDRYKYDIPVLHLGEIYWAKHRLTKESALLGLADFKRGTFTSQKGEPDARKEHAADTGHICNECG